MRDGRALQVAAPKELYERPAARFVADFVGTNNFIAGTVRGGEGDDLLVDTEAGERLTIVKPNDSSGVAPGALVHVSWNDADAYEIQPPEQLQQEVK